jgi:hypothetical protein
LLNDAHPNHQPVRAGKRIPPITFLDKPTRIKERFASTFLRRGRHGLPSASSVTAGEPPEAPVGITTEPTTAALSPHAYYSIAEADFAISRNMNF